MATPVTPLFSARNGEPLNISVARGADSGYTPINNILPPVQGPFTYQYAPVPPSQYPSNAGTGTVQSSAGDFQNAALYQLEQTLNNPASAGYDSAMLGLTSGQPVDYTTAATTTASPGISADISAWITANPYLALAIAGGALLLLFHHSKGRR